MKNIFSKKHIAEFIGTYALVLFGTGSILVNNSSDGALGLLGIAATFGIIITMMIYVFGGISGAHINPAVTISLALGNLFPKKEVALYLVFQVLGAFFASFTLIYLFPESATLGETLPSGDLLKSFVVEIIATFFLMLTILGITSSSEKSTTSLAGLIIGMAVFGLIMFTGPISGGSFNPARSLAPAIMSGNTANLWIYLIAPTLGAILAVFSWKSIKN